MPTFDEETNVLGGIGKIVVVIVIRVLQGRQRLQGGIGLSPKRRLLVPLAMAVIAVIGLQKSSISQMLDAWTALALIAAIVVIGGVIRASCARLSSVPVDALHPGGVLATDRISAPIVEVITLLVSALFAAHSFYSFSGAHTAVSVWMLSAALLEVSSYATLLFRSRTERIAAA